jgi:serine/threonine protein kinase/tetratricopeptide (TPR) repeat protein
VAREDVVISARITIHPLMDARMHVIDTRRWQRASRLLDHAMDLAPETLDVWLDELQGEDSEAAADVKAMLLEHRMLDAEGFLDAPATPGVDVPLAGVTLGGYTLVSPIDQGGMGSVWLATRSDGRFEGRAAVKLLNTHLLNKSGESRFRREGTFLARLTHPHIGRLIDAGISRAGQPYLVLEYVDGRHIDRYCDDGRLGVAARLRLFLDVQAAVAHAHANLIVHRDLKPSNILVTAEGQVKLLDFGIAKLLDAEGSDPAASLLTREGVPLTPKYAAPEQIAGAQITTSTDVYALGVLLFELLTGVHPTGLDSGSAMDFVKATATREPLRLSAVTTAGSVTAAAGRATCRSSTPDRLRRDLRGDLETIVGKALKREPGERYASVAEFAEDVRRFLHDQPIAARPDAFGYRAAKFARRHRRSLGAAAVAVAVLAGTVAFYTSRLAAERDRATQQAAKVAKVNEVLTSLLTGADPFRTPDGTPPTVEGLLDLAATRIGRDLGDHPDVQAEMFTEIGRTFERMNRQSKALPVLEQALAIGRRTLGPEHVRIAHALNDLGVLNRDLGRLPVAEAQLRESLDMRRRLLGPKSKELAITLVELGRVFEDAGRDAEAEPLAREALAIRREIFGEEHRETATSKSALALLLQRKGDIAGAEALFRENMATTRRLLGEDHPNTAASKGNVATVMMLRGDYDGAMTLARESLATRERVFGVGSIDTTASLNTLGNIEEARGRLPQATLYYDQALRLARAHLAPTHTRRLAYEVSSARMRILRGQGASTVGVLREVLDIRQRLYPTDTWRLAQAQSLLGAALAAAGRDAEAEPLMLAALKGLRPMPGIQGREREANRERLVALFGRSRRTPPPDLFQ